MNQDIKNSFKSSFLHEPSADFTNLVEQKIARLKTAPQPEKSSNWMLFVVLFFIIGLPLMVVLFAVFSQIQFPEFSMFDTSPRIMSLFQEKQHIFTELMPYFTYIFVFISVYFLAPHIEKRNSNSKVKIE